VTNNTYKAIDYTYEANDADEYQLTDEQLEEMSEEELDEYYIEEGRIAYRHEWFRYIQDWES
jgi:hypothetical protein